MKKDIWLSYVALPYTTAAYYEKALRKIHNVITIGPLPKKEIIKSWNLQSIENLIKPHDVNCDNEITINDIKIKINSKKDPDLYIWIESGANFLPENLNLLKCPKVAIFIDSHINIDYQLKWATYFDYIFIAQAKYLSQFRDKGINAYWLPLAADEEIHRKLVLPKKYEISFVGTVFPNTRRENLLKQIRNNHEILIQRCFFDEMIKVFNHSKLIFNNAINNDLNMRVFETLSSGNALLTDLAIDSNQNKLFYDNQDIILYDDDNLNEKIKYYLNNDSLREKIAARGNELVKNAHQYNHRIDDLLNVIFNKKNDTFSSDELRSKSTESKKISNKYSSYSDTPSFIIPVLDYSSASKYNIQTLLNDLNEVNGEVIIIFNNKEIAEELKNNHRISRYAIVSENIGVSRAWNVGLELSNSEFCFILNADLHIKNSGVNALLEFIKNNKNVAMVGPQGAFFDEKNMVDYFYFDKNSFSSPIKIDAVSGFYFLINKALFDKNNIKFENNLTPCYFEEWDVGLQIKKAGLLSFILPISDYEHKWSGSINSYRSIKFMGFDENINDILKRNGETFKDKWINKINDEPSIYKSYWKSFALKTIEDCLKQNKINQAYKINELLLKHFNKCKFTLASAGLVEYYLENIPKSLYYFKKALEIDSKYDVAQKNIQLILRKHKEFNE